MEENINIKEVLQSLRRRWKIIVICTLASVLVSAIFTFFLIKPQYEASTKLFVGKEETSGTVSNYDNNDVMMYQKLLKTYSEVIKTKDLAKDAINEAGVNIGINELLNNTTIVPVADTQILQIKVKSGASKDSMDLVSSITNKFIKLSNELVPNGEVKILEDVQAPKNPVSPNKKMNILISLLLGLMVGTGIVFLLEFLDNTFKSKEQLERELEIAVLGVIPTIN